MENFRGRLISPYQHDGVQWLLQREAAEKNPGGFLCDEMGLGKTVQMIATFVQNPKDHTLVVVPKSILTQWKEELNHFAPATSVLIYDKHQKIDKYQVVLAPYSIFKSDTTVFHKLHWDRIVLDEGHEIRSNTSKVSKSCRSLRGTIHWIISGTPIYNSNKDFVTLCSFVGIHKSYVLGMKRKITETYVLRRTKSDFNERLQLPPCDFKMIELDMHPEEKGVYSTIFEKNRSKVREIFKTSTNLGMHYMHILECMLRCRQAMIHPGMVIPGWNGRMKKMEFLVDSIMSHPSEKTLVFCQFKHEMNYIQEVLESKGVGVYRLDGTVPLDARTEIVKEFKKSEGHIVFIIQIKTGGQGLNLHQASRVYITAPSWNPATELQAIARAHRTGQTRRVTIRKIIYSGDQELPSIEQSIVSLQCHKSFLCSEVLNDPRILNQLPKSASSAGILELKKIFQV